MILPTRKSGYFFASKKIAIIQADSRKGIKKRDLIHSTHKKTQVLPAFFVLLLRQIKLLRLFFRVVVFYVRIDLGGSIEAGMSEPLLHDFNIYIAFQASSSESMP